MNQEPDDVLVLGGGFAGVWCARELERRLPRARSITLVSDENYFTFQPLLAEVVGGSIEPSHVVSPLRHMLHRTRVLRGVVERLELLPGEGRAEVSVPGAELRLVLAARTLVLALGSVVDVTRIPGMAEHALLMKTLGDALRLRHALLERLEQAAMTADADERRALLTFVVVGGGFSGVETAAEILDLLLHCRRFYPALREQQPRVYCVHSQERVLPELPAELGEFARRKLVQHGMQLLLGRRTTAVSAEAVYLDDGSVLRARTVVCTIGNAPHPMLAGLGLPTEKGRLVVDQHLRLLARDDLFAIGDCAYAPDGLGGVAPPTAQYALRQGTHVGRQIARRLRHEPLQPFRHKNQGMLATIGHRNAVAYVAGVKLSGFVAWWLWRTVYLLKLPRLERKLRVVIDWTLRLFFPRDQTFFDLRATRGLTRVHLEPGETLFRQGDVSAAFYVVEDGCIELTQRDERGAQVLCEQVGPGEHFGEGSLLRNGVRRTTATALERSTVVSFTARRFLQITDAWAALRKMLEQTSRRFLPAAETLPARLSEELAARKVDELMVEGVRTLPCDATLNQGLTELAEKPFGCFPLVDDAGRLCAIITRTDLHEALRTDLPLESPLRAIATERVHTVRPGDPMRRVIELMRRHSIQHVPVVGDDQRLVGLVGLRELLRAAIATRVKGALPRA
jgi:NADH dehydrogenase